MKIPQCYYNMTLRLGQRKTVWLIISVKVNMHKMLHLFTCCSCTEKCHLAVNAYQNEINIK